MTRHIAQAATRLALVLGFIAACGLAGWIENL